MAVQFDVFGRVVKDHVLSGNPDHVVHEELRRTASGKRAVEGVVNALGRLGLSVREISDLLDLDLETLDGALEREAARVQALHAAERKKRADVRAAWDARAAECDRERAAYAKDVMPRRAALAEQLAKLAGEAPEFADIVEAARELAAAPLPVSDWEAQCREQARASREYEAQPLSAVYPSEYEDRDGSLVPNALKLIKILVDERKAARAVRTTQLKAELKHLGVEV